MNSNNNIGSVIHNIDNTIHNIANEIMSSGFTLHGISELNKNDDNYYWINSGRLKPWPELDSIPDEQISKLMIGKLRSLCKAKNINDDNTYFCRVYDDGFGFYDPPNIYYNWNIRYIANRNDVIRDYNNRMDGKLNHLNNDIILIQNRINQLKNEKYKQNLFYKSD